MEAFSNEIVDFLKSVGQWIEDNGVQTQSRGFSTLSNSRPGTIAWIRDSDFDVSQLFCSLLLAPADFRPQSDKICIVQVKDPRLSFSRLGNFLSRKKISRPFVSEQALIGKNVSLGKDVTIYPGVVIGDNCSIGDGAILFANVSLYDDVRLGDRCIVHAGAVLGSHGFGFQMNEDGWYEKLPHFGSVRIDEDVEIGANTCIDRGTIDDTRIGRNTKIDDQCYFAHNSSIGMNCIISAGCKILGSVAISDNVWLGPSVTIKNKIRIGANAFVGIGSLVLKDIAEGAMWYGSPARFARANDVSFRPEFGSKFPAKDSYNGVDDPDSQLLTGRL